MIGDDDINELESDDLFPAEQSPKTSENIQDTWVNALTVELEAVAAVDPRPVGVQRPREPGKVVFSQTEKKWIPVEKGFSAELEGVRPEIPKTLPALSAMDWKDSHLGVDFRPHLYDPGLGCHLLVDSGSQVCALPPDPGDKPMKGVFLKAANGSRILKKKKIFSIQIGRKS